MPFRFDEETEETAEQELARRLQQPAATQRSGACTSLHSVNVLKTDFDSGDQCYVFNVAASTTTGIVAAALSNHTVKLYNARDSGGFTYLGELKGHTDVISEISFARDDNPHALYSSSEDGSVRGWDSRTGQQAERYRSLACRGKGPAKALVQQLSRNSAAVLQLEPANSSVSASWETTWLLGQTVKFSSGTGAQGSSVVPSLIRMLRM